MAINDHAFELAKLDMDTFAKLVEADKPVVVILPLGVVEPHGPHLPLETDTIISKHAAQRAAVLIAERGMTPLIAPSIPFGVTKCAQGFLGAVSVDADALSAYLKSTIQGFLDNRVTHVCLVNNHLEPEHDQVVRSVAKTFVEGTVSVASPLMRKWAKTLSDEFKKGECHAGEYETSMVMATEEDLVNETIRKKLPYVPISLSEKIRAGITNFKVMGLSKSYAGSPATATVEHGEQQLSLLAKMIATEIEDAMSTTPQEKQC